MGALLGGGGEGGGLLGIKAKVCKVQHPAEVQRRWALS
uniref:Uncharacterized protein n=1 Tax=Rhizophora mucronata TaxID=61149 RepID=A0A2P2ISW3_RHIMU